MSLSRLFTVFALCLVVILAATCVTAQKNAAPSGSSPQMNAVFIPIAFTRSFNRETASEQPAVGGAITKFNQTMLGKWDSQFIGLWGQQ